MRRFFHCLLALSLLTLTLLAAPGSASAAQPQRDALILLPAVDPGANIAVQNMGSTATRAAIVFEQGQPRVVLSGLIAPGGSWTYTVGATQTGSAWVTSDSAWNESSDDTAFSGQPLAASVGRGQAPGGGSGSYTGVGLNEHSALLPTLESDGVGSGYYRIFAPIFFRNYGGWNSRLYVQNAQLSSEGVASPVYLDVTFYDQQGILAGYAGVLLTALGDINGGWSMRFDSIVNYAGLPDNFLGSAWIRASGPVVAVVDEYKSPLTLTYRAMPAAHAPQGFNVPLYGALAFSDYNGWSSGLQVLNTSENVAQVAVYLMDPARHKTEVGRYALLPRAVVSLDFRNLLGTLPSNFVGSLIVESEPATSDVAASPIAAVVNELKWSSLMAMAYNPASLDAGAIAIGIPSLVRSASGWGSGIQVMDIDPSGGFTDVSLQLFDASGPVASFAFDLSAYSVVSVDLRNAPYVTQVPMGFAGSGKLSVISSTQDARGQMAVVVNELNISSGPSDRARAYEGFPMFPNLFEWTPGLDLEP